MSSKITFLLDGKTETIDFTIQTHLTPTTTVLQYLRGLPNHKGVKEGCAEGDCGACTVVLAESGPNGQLVYMAVNSCLFFLPKLHGKQLITVENLQDDSGNLHPVQKALAESNGSQCGFCTTGIVMSLFGHYKQAEPATREHIEDTLSGNLCRCTGYQPILETAESVFKTIEADHFSEHEKNTLEKLKAIQNQSITIETPEQIYHLPASLKELLQLRTEHPQAILINGSTDAALRVTKNHELLTDIIDLANVRELQEVQQSPDTLRVGSGVTINQLMSLTEKSFPAIYKMCKTFGSKQIRNLATIGGNLGSASPIGDLAPALMAYNARVIVQSLHGQRKIVLDDFITGYRQTTLAEDEIILAIEMESIKPSTLVDAYKISRRYDLDIATVSAGFRVELDAEGKVRQSKLIYGGMAAMTSRTQKTEKFLSGKKWSREIVEEAMLVLKDEFKPISDARAGADFRSIAAGNLLLKFYLEKDDKKA